MFTLLIFCGIFHSSPPPLKIFTPLLLPLMAFHHRKLLHKNHHQFHVSPAPSPVQSPLSLPKPLSLELPELPLPSMEDHHIHVLRIALIITSCMVGVFMFLCTFSVLRRVYYNSRRQNNDQNQNRTTSPILFDFNDDSPVAEDEEPVINHPIWFIRTVGLQQSLIDSITVFKYRKDEALIDGTECSVCLGEFEEDESLRLLPKCSHGFHIPCIDTWLRSHKNCPLCRAPVFHETEERVTEQSQSQSQEAETDNSDGGEGEGSSNRVGESESSEVRIEIEEDGDSGGIQDKMLGNSREEETKEPIRRSFSMDSCSPSVVFRDVDLDRESSESDTHFGEKMNSSICSKELGIVKSGGSGSFSSICKLGLIGRALQKRPVLMRRSFSHNRKFLSSRHCRSHSSTLPL